MADLSTSIRSTQLSVPSPDGLYIATLNSSHLELRRTSNLDHITRSIHVPQTGAKFVTIRWSPIVKGAGSSGRFLLADEDTVRVWDVEDISWSAKIDNGSGGAGKVANVEFGSDDNEVLVFSSLNANVMIWSLWTGKSIEIKDPKFATKGYGRSRIGRSGIFALLTRPAAQDIITLHIPGSYEVLNSFAPHTVDAKGLKWSPDGRWFAVWDTPSTGYKVLIYTAEGQLFRTYTGDYFDDGLHGLGIKSLEWSPNSDFLVVCGYEKTITLLATRTFSPAVQLAHPSTAKLSEGTVWQELANAPMDRSFCIAHQPICPPTPNAASNDNQPRIGTSILAFSADGNFLATKDDSMPTCAWIWDLSRMKARAVIVQHAVIKRLSWHSTNEDLLMIQCIQGENILYVWNAQLNEPHVLTIPEVKFSGKAEAQWIPKSPRHRPTILFGDQQGFAVTRPQGHDNLPSPVSEIQLDGLRDSDQSEDDSLYNALSGKKPNVKTREFLATPGSDTEDVALVDDTFRDIRGVGAH